VRQKPLPWPPQQGEIWVAMSAWCTHISKASASIAAGTALLVLAPPQPYSPVDDSWALEVVWQGGKRRIVAAPKDLMPLEWLAPLSDM